jgi:putative PIN family toxin of toxin-antitoxin system
MIRAVLDTNVWVSYALAEGDTLFKLISHWEEENFISLISPQIVEELKEVLERPHIREKMLTSPHRLIESIERNTEQTSGKLQLTGICRDPKDDMFIACAVEGGADYIVSGDRDLLDLGKFQGIRIVEPGEFIALLELSKPRR